MYKLGFTFSLLLGLLLGNFCQAQTSHAQKKQIKSKLGEITELYESAIECLDYEPSKAVLYSEIALKKSSKTDIPKTLFINILNTAATAYFNVEEYGKSLSIYEKLHTIYADSGKIEELAITQYNIASAHRKLGTKKEAEIFYKQSLEKALKIENTDLQSINYLALYELKQSRRQYYEAIEYLKQYAKLDDKIFSSDPDTQEVVKIINMSSGVQEVNLAALTNKGSQNFNNSLQNDLVKEKLKKAEIALSHERENNSNKTIILFIISALGLSFTIVWVSIVQRKKRISQDILKAQKLEIEKQAALLKNKNNKLQTSIEYARKIQDAILKPQDEIFKFLPNSFIYYQPKDVLSGDFYWFSKVKDELILAAIDCTGHGIPGAFMSIIGFTLLNNVVNNNRITKPDRILKHLHIGMLAALQQTDNRRGVDNGMDMSLCTINPKLKRFQFAGAKNHLYVMQGDKLKVLKANKHSIGGRPLRLDNDKVVEFSSYDFMYDERTSIYMMSDGYIDQFGGSKNQKFNTNRFKEMLMENRNLPMHRQKELMQTKFESWRGDREQVDDVLVMGVKL